MERESWEQLALDDPSIHDRPNRAGWGWFHGPHEKAGRYTLLKMIFSTNKTKKLRIKISVDIIQYTKLVCQAYFRFFIRA